MLLYEGLPERTETCGMETDKTRACCVYWAYRDTRCGTIWFSVLTKFYSMCSEHFRITQTGRIRVCERLELKVSGVVLGAPIEYGGSFNFTVQARFIRARQHATYEPVFLWRD